MAGEPGALEPAVDEAAYRIAQEALTNAVKHAAHAVVGDARETLLEPPARS